MQSVVVIMAVMDGESTARQKIASSWIVLLRMHGIYILQYTQTDRQTDRHSNSLPPPPSSTFASVASHPWVTVIQRLNIRSALDCVCVSLLSNQS